MFTKAKFSMMLMLRMASLHSCRRQTSVKLLMLLVVEAQAVSAHHAFLVRTQQTVH
ncbi:hypothetical protein DPMN_012912 [Dreissena polymorpha]|uniref:Uncharacterized protein n=1 Tax=Dreissena polymorpha TaxID=45954 RepID=A0A9D4S365_DREPO|nr:hypothetical protein DPMN_012912 [Dreissena polymorpha]